MISRKVILILLFVCLFITYSLSQYESDIFDKDLLTISLVLSSLLMFVPFITRYDKNVKRNYFRPTIFFVLGYFIVFFQKYYDLLFGFIKKTDHIFVDVSLINRSLIISVTALIMFYIGYFLTRYHKKKKKQQKSTLMPIYVYDTNLLHYLFWAITVLLCLLNAKNIGTGNYNQANLEKEAGGIGNYMSILYMVVYFSLLSMTVYNCITLGCTKLKGFVKQFGRINMLCVIIYSVLMVLIGVRSSVIVIIASLTCSIMHIMNKRVKLWKLAIAFAIITYIVSFIGINRKATGTDVSSQIEAVQFAMLEQKSILPTTLELAGSLETFNYALDYVPSKHDYLYGSFHIRNLVSAIPFSSYFKSSMFDPHWKYRSSDYFITYIIQGENYSYGNGSSINADLYLNYGIPGVIVGLFLLGMIFWRVESAFCTTKSPKLFSILFFLIFVGYALPYCRSGYLTPINYIVFCYILVTIYTPHFKRRVKKFLPTNKKKIYEKINSIYPNIQ